MATLKNSLSSAPTFRQILGIKFFNGTANQAVNVMMAKRGLLVVPAAPALVDLPRNPSYRDALVMADLVLTDSSLMVMLWNSLCRDNVRRVSGLEYLEHLLKESDFRRPGESFWIMASEKSSIQNLQWLSSQGIEIPRNYVHVAPMYGTEISDEDLLKVLSVLQPSHIIVTVGGGTQERLGLYLRAHLDYLPGIHCIGAAIAFLSGDQVRIPLWADRLYLGWLFRCTSEPSRYVRRYWEARKLIPMMIRYRENLPF